jgi:hypothetical protein
MSKKKTAIGDLIKSDMSRRTIGEGAKTAEKPKQVPAQSTEKPAEKRPLAVQPAQAAAPEGNADLMVFIEKEAQSIGLTEEADLIKLYDFLQGQTMRYIRGFDAGQRFHG